MIKRATENDILGNIALAHSDYGDSTDFRNSLRGLGFDCAVGVLAKLGVVRLARDDRINEKPQSAAGVIARCRRRHLEK